jgi:biotin carboxyl carrier protein
MKSSGTGHVTTPMPGTIVDVLTKVGAIHVVKGDSVNPDEALVEIG